MVVPKRGHVIIEKFPDPEGRFLDIISQGLKVKIDAKNYPDSIFFFDTNNKYPLFEYNNSKKNNNKRCWFWCDDG